MSALSPDMFAAAVEEQRAKLLNILGCAQCIRIAAEMAPDEAVEIEGALKLLEDQLDDVIAGLERPSLEAAATKHVKEGEEEPS